MDKFEIRERFISEVLKFGANAVLPSNLSDKWLNELTRQALSISDQIESSKFPELLSAVLSILFMRSNYEELKMQQSELINYLHLYSIELYAETLNRSGDAKISSATLDTILTDTSFHKTTELSEALEKT